MSWSDTAQIYYNKPSINEVFSRINSRWVDLVKEQLKRKNVSLYSRPLFSSNKRNGRGFRKWTSLVKAQIDCNHDFDFLDKLNSRWINLVKTQIDWNDYDYEFMNKTHSKWEDLVKRQLKKKLDLEYRVQPKDIPRESPTPLPREYISKPTPDPQESPTPLPREYIPKPTPDPRESPTTLPREYIPKPTPDPPTNLPREVRPKLVENRIIERKEPNLLKFHQRISESQHILHIKTIVCLLRSILDVILTVMEDRSGHPLFDLTDGRVWRGFSNRCKELEKQLSTFNSTFLEQKLKERNEKTNRNFSSVIGSLGKSSVEKLNASIEELVTNARESGIIQGETIFIRDILLISQSLRDLFKYMERSLSGGGANARFDNTSTSRGSPVVKAFIKHKEEFSDSVEGSDNESQRAEEKTKETKEENSKENKKGDSSEPGTAKLLEEGVKAFGGNKILEKGVEFLGGTNLLEHGANFLGGGHLLQGAKMLGGLVSKGKEDKDKNNANLNGNNRELSGKDEEYEENYFDASQDKSYRKPISAKGEVVGISGDGDSMDDEIHVVHKWPPKSGLRPADHDVEYQLHFPNNVGEECEMNGDKRKPSQRKQKPENYKTEDVSSRDEEYEENYFDASQNKSYRKPISTKGEVVGISGDGDIDDEILVVNKWQPKSGPRPADHDVEYQLHFPNNVGEEHEMKAEKRKPSQRNQKPENYKTENVSSRSDTAKRVTFDFGRSEESRSKVKNRKKREKNISQNMKNSDVDEINEIPHSPGSSKDSRHTNSIHKLTMRPYRSHSRENEENSVRTNMKNTVNVNIYNKTNPATSDSEDDAILPVRNIKSHSNTSSDSDDFINRDIGITASFGSSGSSRSGSSKSHSFKHSSESDKSSVGDVLRHDIGITASFANTSEDISSEEDLQPNPLRSAYTSEENILYEDDFKPIPLKSASESFLYRKPVFVDDSVSTWTKPKKPKPKPNPVVQIAKEGLKKSFQVASLGLGSWTLYYTFSCYSDCKCLNFKDFENFLDLRYV